MGDAGSREGNVSFTGLEKVDRRLLTSAQTAQC